MPTVYTSIEDFADQMRALGLSLVEGSNSLRELHTFVEALQHQGETPNDIETRVNNLLEGYGAQLRRAGAELGDESTAPLIPTTWAKEYRANSPSGLKHFELGVLPPNHFDEQYDDPFPRSLLLFNDATSTTDIWDGFAAGTVLSVREARRADLDGNYTLRYATDEKGSSGNPAAAATYGPNDSGDGFWDGNFRNGSGTGWGTSGDWAIASNKATFTYSSANGNLTHALAGMTANSLYAIDFGLKYGNAGTGTIKVSIGGDFYFQITGMNDTSHDGKHTLYVNAPSATPTLTITATRTEGAFQFDVEYIHVRGVQGIMAEETFTRSDTDSKPIVAVERIP